MILTLSCYDRHEGRVFITATEGQYHQDDGV